VRGKQLELETLETNPRLFRVRSLLSSDECALVRSMAEGHYTESASYDEDSGEQFDAARDGRRRSHNAFVGLLHNKRFSGFPTSERIERLQRRVASLIRMGMPNAEPWQVVRYAPGGFYRLHQDGVYFPEYNTTRVATVLVYLNSLHGDDGGATNFPYSGGVPATPRDAHSCSEGRTVVPHQGDALIFYNVLPRAPGRVWRPEELVFDSTAKHAACPLVRSEKYIANIWLHSADPTAGLRWGTANSP